jgi:two-component system, OmpR family, alkaline phosphatase synthesis response regulator PhoP
MKHTLLIVEDDETLREIYALKMTIEGFDVLAARDGAEGLELATTHKPDLILLDILMPRMTGVEFLKLYAQQPDKAVVVVISNKSTPDEISEVKKMGAADYLIKSQHTPDQIVAIVRSYIDLAKKTKKSRTSS